MIGLLRFVGILNAAVWFGTAIFFSFGAGLVPFSPEMKTLLGLGIGFLLLPVIPWLFRKLQ